MDINDGLVDKIRNDKGFRQEFVNDANACIEKYFGETINANIMVKKNTKDVYYIVVPNMSAELSLNQLGNIQAAGVDPVAAFIALFKLAIGIHDIRVRG